MFSSMFWSLIALITLFHYAQSSPSVRVIDAALGKPAHQQRNTTTTTPPNAQNASQNTFNPSFEEVIKTGLQAVQKITSNKLLVWRLWATRDRHPGLKASDFLEVSALYAMDLHDLYHLHNFEPGYNQWSVSEETGGAVTWQGFEWDQQRIPLTEAVELAKHGTDFWGPFQGFCMEYNYFTFGEVIYRFMAVDEAYVVIVGASTGRVAWSDQVYTGKCTGLGTDAYQSNTTVRGSPLPSLSETA